MTAEQLFHSGKIKLWHADCGVVVPQLPLDSFDAIITDPPYHLGFMGKKWDQGDLALQADTWVEILHVLKPGGHLLAFGGTRTFHRMACAIEDAGFEIRDTVMWLYGQGFPKSKALLKPAWEPIIMARRPGKQIDLNIDACRIGTTKRVPGSLSITENKIWGKGIGSYRQTGKEDGHNPNIGRWPANVCHDGSDEVLEKFPNAPGQLADVSHSAPSKKSKNVYGKMNREGEASAERRYTEKGSTNFAALPGQRRADNGSAARFFYTAKASAAERNGSKHPTVKPLALMRWLCRLVTPPGGLILDPFGGSGTTAEAALLEGFRCTIIENEDVSDIIKRMKRSRP
jgi:DNA modification methylase